MVMRNRGRRSTAKMKAFTGREFEMSALNQLDVFTPTIHAPGYGIELLKYMLKKGGLALHDVGLDEGVFGPDGEQTDGHFPGEEMEAYHFVELLKLYDFNLGSSAAEKKEILHDGVAWISTLIAVLIGLLGSDGAARVWCKIYEACDPNVVAKFHNTSDTRVSFLRQSATSAGWLQHFQDYSKVLFHQLRNSADTSKMVEDWAIDLLDDPYPRIVGKALLRLQRRLPEQIRPISGGASSGGLSESIIKRNWRSFEKESAQDLLGGWDSQGETSSLRAIGGYEKDMNRLTGSTLASPAAWVLPSMPMQSTMDSVTPVQEFGVTRGNGADTWPHSGIDFKAKTGTPVANAFEGVVVDIIDDAPKVWSGRGGRRGSKGNFVRVETEVKDGMVLESDYLHLSEVNDKLGRGEVLQAGDILGAVGNTGNSTGPHLHVTMRFVKRDESGSVSQIFKVDPIDMFLEPAFVVADRVGVPIAPRPAYSGGVLVLTAALNRRYRGFSDSIQAAASDPTGGMLSSAWDGVQRGVSSIASGVESAAATVGRGLMSVQAWADSEVGRQALTGILTVLGIPPTVTQTVIAGNAKLMEKIQSMDPNDARDEYVRMQAAEMEKAGMNPDEAKQAAEILYTAMSSAGGTLPMDRALQLGQRVKARKSNEAARYRSAQPDPVKVTESFSEPDTGGTEEADSTE